jgi:hypothetical protein
MSASLTTISVLLNFLPQVRPSTFMIFSIDQKTGSVLSPQNNPNVA